MSGGRAKVDRTDFAFFLHDAAQLIDEGRRFTLTPDEINLLNPNTGTCPVFRFRRDAEITLGIYRRVPVLVKQGDPDGNPWGISFMQGLFNMTSDSDLFRTRDELEEDGWHLDGNVFINADARMLPLYEAKMLHHYDHRWASYEPDGSIRHVTLIEKRDPNFVVMPRYWVPGESVLRALADKRWRRDWLTGFRKICRATDERTVIMYALPKGGLGDSGNMLLPVANHTGAAWIAATATAVVFDYILRQKLGGSNLNFFHFEQLPVLETVDSMKRRHWLGALTPEQFVVSRFIELVFTVWDMESLAKDLGHHGPPFLWDEERRSLLQAELDAAFFHLYGVERDDVDYIMETFPIVRRKDKAKFGEYRTKRLILEIYDAMADAIRTGQPYETVVDPPPGYGARHPDRIER